MYNNNSDTFRFVTNNMMLRKNEDWNPDGDYGKGDALWRTSLSYIAYKAPMLKDGILSCFRKFKMINKKKYLYQGSRCFDRYCEDDVSRDQIIMAISALKINGDHDELKEIGKHLPYRLSRRFVMGPTMWLWIKYLVTEKKRYNYLFQIFELIEFLPSVLWNKFLRMVMGWNKEYSQEWYMSIDNTIGFWSVDDEWIINDNWNVNNGQRLYSNYQYKKKNNKLFKIIDSMEYPEYALHLTAWMVYCSKNSLLKKILQKLCIWLAEKDNLLIRKLMNDNVTEEEIEKYKPTRSFRWSSRYNGTSYTNYLEGDDAIYNTIDKDILYGI